MDKEFLDRQIEEKKRERFLERERECLIDTAFVRNCQLAMKEERHQEEARICVTPFICRNARLSFINMTLVLIKTQERRRMIKELNEFRQLYQKPEYSRDFDLNDPDLLKKSRPLCDEDEVGLASAQR